MDRHSAASSTAARPAWNCSEEIIQRDVERRRSGTSKYTSQRREPDRVRILSGVFEGRTTGTPIGLLVENIDQRSYDYEKIKDRFRPGHADYTYQQKYGFRDYRGGGRSSARETVIRVAAGAIARQFLAGQGIEIYGYLAQIGTVSLRCDDRAAIDANPFFCGEPDRVPELEAMIDQLRRDGDSIGARVTVIATGLPPGSRRARVRSPRRGPGARDDEHQRRQGRRDRRRLRAASRSVVRNIATN